MASATLKESPIKNLFQVYVFVLMGGLPKSCGLYIKHVEFRQEADMRKKLLEHALIPEVVEDPPKHAAELIFVTGALSDFGNKITPDELFATPKVVRFRCEQEELFTILLTDLDAPSRNASFKREWLHWAVGNCESDNHLAGDEIASYVAINPQRGTGFHRYVFYVYKQPNNTRIKFQERFSNRSEAGRNNFDTKDFAKAYKLGNIYGINFFLSEWIPEEKKRPFTDPGPCWEP